MTQTIQIDLLRHGEPEGGSRYRGNRIDDPLTEKGWQQMWSGVGEKQTWDVIITSPLLRCFDFANKLAEQRNIPVVVDEQFKEIGFGVWEGKIKSELKIKREKEFNAFYADPVFNTPEGAEPVGDFFIRVASAFNNVRTQHTGKNILIIAHAGVIRAIVTHVINAPVECMYKLNVLPGHVSRINYTENKAALDRLNFQLRDE